MLNQLSHRYKFHNVLQSTTNQVKESRGGPEIRNCQVFWRLFWQVVKDTKKAPQLSSLLSSLLKLVFIYVIIVISSFQMIVKIVIASLTVTGFEISHQCFNQKAKTNRSLYAQFCSFFEQVTVKLLGILIGLSLCLLMLWLVRVIVLLWHFFFFRQSLENSSIIIIAVVNIIINYYYYYWLFKQDLQLMDWKSFLLCWVEVPVKCIQQ